MARHQGMNAFVSTATCRQFVEDEEHFLYNCPLYSAMMEQHSFLFGHDHGSIRLLLERHADQMPSVARYIHLCFHAWMSDESHLAPHPGL